MNAIDSAFLFGNSYSVFIDCHTILLHVFLPCLLTFLFLSVHMPRHRGLRPKSCFALAFCSPKSYVQCCMSIVEDFFPTFGLFLLFGKECSLRGLFWLFLSNDSYFRSEYVMLSELAPFGNTTSNLLSTFLVYCQRDHFFRLSYLLPFYWYLFLAWQNSLGLDHLPELGSELSEFPYQCSYDSKSAISLTIPSATADRKMTVKWIEAQWGQSILTQMFLYIVSNLPNDFSCARCEIM